MITDKGLALLTKIDNEAEEWLDTMKGITKAEAVELNRLLDKVRK